MARLRSVVTLLVFLRHAPISSGVDHYPGGENEGGFYGGPTNGYAPPPASEYYPSQPFLEEGPKPVGLGARAAGAVSAGGATLIVSKAAVGSVRPVWAACGACAALGMSACGGRAGSAADALGIATLDAFGRVRAMDRDAGYPLFKQLKSAIRLAPRLRFPPDAVDPWRYRPSGPTSPRFSMIQCIAAAAFLGGMSTSFLPTVPFVPTSLLAIAAAALAVFLVTLDDARGDAVRCFVARTIAVLRILIEASSDAELPSKTAAALRLGGNHLTAFDAKWGISRTAAGLARSFAALVASRVSPRDTAPSPGSRRPSPLDDDLYGAYAGATTFNPNTAYAPPPNHHQPPHAAASSERDWYS